MKKSNNFLNRERHYKKWTSSHTSGQFKVKYTPFQWARTSSISSDQWSLSFFLLHLINKEFDVISFTNGYTDELAIKTKWMNPGLLFSTGHWEFLCGGKHFWENNSDQEIFWPHHPLTLQQTPIQSQKSWHQLSALYSDFFLRPGTFAWTLEKQITQDYVSTILKC